MLHKQISESKRAVTPLLVIILALYILFTFSVLSNPGYAKEIIPGPITAQMVRVIDGDTIRVKAMIWLGLEKNIKVRLNGVHAPELYRPKCEHERQLAEQAKNVTTDAIAQQPIQLINIKYGKYSDRVIADVLNHQGHHLTQFLLDQALALPTKTGKHLDWCRKKEN